jgi:hypothetical protein
VYGAIPHKTGIIINTTTARTSTFIYDNILHVIAGKLEGKQTTEATLSCDVFSLVDRYQHIGETCWNYRKWKNILWSLHFSRKKKELSHFCFRDVEGFTSADV